MIIVDTALAKLEAEGRPIRVGLVGAGFMGSGVARQIVTVTKGMQLVGIANRRIGPALDAWRQLGIEPVQVEGPAAIGRTIAAGQPVATEDALALVAADGVDAVIEVTGSVDYGAEVVLAAITAGKHVVQMNAELDGTVGPILRAKADSAGVIYSFSDGDQPGVEMNLFRFVQGIGVQPRLCGNIKGLHDPKRNPTTQQQFAKRWGQKPEMVASFADGTKISFEQAIVANGTGFSVVKRGMIGPDFSGGDPTAPLVPLEETVSGFEAALTGCDTGLVDYVVGARPGPGVFVLGTCDDPRQQHYLALYKLGAGPYYCFYTPYHLCHFEVPTSVARAVLFGDAVLAPQAGPRVGVIAVAKKALRRGDRISQFGGYEAYGVAENYPVMEAEGLLPMGLAVGATLVRDVAEDQPLTFGDVEFPAGRTADRLYEEQRAMFASATQPARAMAQ